MNNYSKTILIVIIILGLNAPCFANPLSKLMSILQRDLIVDVLYKNHRNLIPGSEVYLAADPKDQKILIGRVRKVSLVASQMSKVEISVDQKYKGKIYDTTPFVLMSNIFSQHSNAYIVAVSPLEPSDKILLKSGSSVKGITFVEYKIAIAKEELKKVMHRIQKQNNDILSQLEEYLDTVNTEEFRKKIDALIHQISQFSIEQKETFKREVLPALENMVDSVIKQLEEQKDMEESKDLKKRLQEIENMVDV